MRIPNTPAENRDYSLGYHIVRHRGLQTRYLYHEAVSTIRGIDVQIAPGLQVAYVMGVGDELPSAITQLGAEVRLLSEADLAGDLGQFDVILLGTRAYAVRKDLVTFNQRLLDYVYQGGNLIVLYNTPEFRPEKWAPFTAQLPDNPEEVSEENSPVAFPQPDHPVLSWPNKITEQDFRDWVEQRGSKFFSRWDEAYVPLVETHDRGQQPQMGGWLTARYGEGYYTYFAYALHRQTPYGVPGPFRILANLLSMGKR